MQDEVMWSAVVAWITSRLIEIGKQIDWLPWNTETAQLNVVVSRLGAVLAAVGVHASFDTAAGVLTVTGLTATGVLTAGLELARQLMLQEAAYRWLVKPAGRPEVES